MLVQCTVVIVLADIKRSSKLPFFNVGVGSLSALLQGQYLGPCFIRSNANVYVLLPSDLVPKCINVYWKWLHIITPPNVFRTHTCLEIYGLGSYLEYCNFKIITNVVHVFREFCYDVCGTMPLLNSHGRSVFGLLNALCAEQVLRKYLL